MEGFTPWELASLKVMFHRFDDQHKGYLDAEDMRRVCAACSLVLTDSEFCRLVETMDTDGDLQLSFDEFVVFLALSGPDNPDAVKLRAHMMGDRAALTAGAALGILPLLKSKAAVVLGTLFYDPIRLFRDTFVDYSSTLRQRMKRTAAREATEGVPSLWAVIQAHTRETHILRTSAALVYTITLDCMVGVAMFVTYAKVRRYLIECAETLKSKPGGSCDASLWALRASLFCKPDASRNGDADHMSGRSPGTEEHVDSSTVHSALTRIRERLADRSQEFERLTQLRDELPSAVERVAAGIVHGHPLRLEACSGFVGGAASGFCEQPCRYLATFGAEPAAVPQRHSRRFPACMLGLRRAFHKTPFLMVRSACGHAAFFAAFSGTKAFVYRKCFGRHSSLQWRRTSLRDSVVTTIGGCMAGAAYRSVVLPMTNLHQDRLVFLNGLPSSRFWLSHRVRDVGARRLLQVAFKGYGESLMYTMPVTGVAFLLYEVTLMKT